MAARGASGVVSTAARGSGRRDGSGGEGSDTWARRRRARSIGKINEGAFLFCLTKAWGHWLLFMWNLWLDTVRHREGSA